MAITRDFTNNYQVTEFTREINELDRLFSLTPAGAFEMFETTQNSITFEKDERTTTLIPSVPRGPRGSTYNQDRVFKTFSLPLAYFKHSDYLTPEDIQGVRMFGQPDGVMRIDVARARKLEEMRRSYDQSMEYMKWKLMTTGQCITPNGILVADLFEEFQVTQQEVTLDLTSTDFDLGTVVREIKRKVRDGMKNGGVMVEPVIFLESSDFDALVSHANVKEAYRYFSATVNVERDDIVDGFRTSGVTFRPIDGAFTLPDGTVEPIMTAGVGHAVPPSGIYRAYSGPSNKLSGANGPIADLYAYEYLDPKDEGMEFQIEANVLFTVDKPAALIKLNIVK